MTPCPRCRVETIQATLPDGARITLDAEPCDDGVYAAWLHREGLNWVWRTRHKADSDRFTDARLRRLHACRPSDTQLELGAA